MNSLFAVAEDRPAPLAAGILRGMGTAALNVTGRVIAARRRGRTMRILSGLDDAALKDIGISRSQIDAIERDTRYTPKYPEF